MKLLVTFPMPTTTSPNLLQSVPFLGVTDMPASLRFYVDGLGFEMTKHWVDQDRLRWCWLQHGGAALMLQEFAKEGHGGTRPEGALEQGVTLEFICRDALAIYRQARERALQPSRPFVGNGMWVTTLSDPDGYRVEFESETDVPEGTELQE